MARVYTNAAYCRRGHWNSWDTAEKVDAFCPTCGAGVLQGCEGCGAPLEGIEVNPTVVVVSTHSEPPPNFCPKCSKPFPWANRDARIFELENMLDREELDEADALTVREQLEALRNPDLDDEEQAQRWGRVRAKAPGLWARGANIIEGLVGAAIRKQLDL